MLMISDVILNDQQSWSDSEINWMEHDYVVLMSRMAITHVHHNLSYKCTNVCLINIIQAANIHRIQEFDLAIR